MVGRWQWGFCWIQNFCKRFAACFGVFDCYVNKQKKKSDFST